MISNKLTIIFISILVITACSNKQKETIIEKEKTENTANLAEVKKEESIEGTYISNECDINLKITKTKNGYAYFLKTNSRKVNGKATFAKQNSGENYLTLEGIQWDDYEGDISNEEENDSIPDSEKPTKEIETPVGIDANYVKDTLTIQNYGNAMNSYTKLSECGLKYIQLIKSNSKK